MTRRLDPLGPAVALLAGVLFLLRGFDGMLTRDLALYAYAGQRVADGVPPYVGVMNRSGPLAHLVPGAGAWVGDVLDVDDLLAITIIIGSLGLVTATSIVAALVLVVMIAAAGTLFWFLVKAMARIQMPERPGASRR